MNRGGAGWIIFILSAILALVFLITSLIGQAHAHDKNRPELDSWYRSLKSGKGPCCGGPSEDATHLSELQWRTKGDGYEVFIENEWIDVPPAAIVPVPNVDGRALVWLYHYDGHPFVRCFMPGTLS